MPPVSKISTEQQLEIYIQYKDELFNNYIIKPVKSEIFLRLKPILGDMTVNAIYLSVKKMKNEIWGISFQMDECLNDESNEDEEINKIDMYENDYSNKYIVQLNNSEFSPVIINKRHRSIPNAPRNWTGTLLKILWEVVERKHLCPYTFKNHHYTLNEFNAKGSCVECGGFIIARTIQDCSFIEIFMYSGDSNVIHRKKRKLDGTIKNEVEGYLEKMKVDLILEIRWVTIILHWAMKNLRSYQAINKLQT